MKHLIKLYIASLLLVSASTGVSAQELKQKKDTAHTYFDATKEALSKRYRHPDAVPFDKEWKKNVYLSLFGGMDRMVPRGDADFSTGPIGGISAGILLSPSHSLRLSLLGGTMARKIDNETLTRFGIQADYLLNITSFTSGYNPGRIFELSTVTGIGYQYSSLLGKAEHVGELHLGLQLKLHPTAHVDFYIEPRFSILTDGIDHSYQKNWHKYDMTYGAVVGMNYRFKAWAPFGRMKILDGESFLDNTFISVAAGGQFQSSRLTDEIGLTKSIGPHFSLSVGKWLIPAFGLRLSGFTSGDTWHKKVMEATETAAQEEFYEMSSYAGGRLEGMLNVLYFFNGHNFDSRFNIHLLAGGELGHIKKENGYYPAKGVYTGFTGGLQLKYGLFDNVAVFVEPRLTMASYSMKTNERENGRYVAKKYTDNLVNLNVGIEISRASLEKRLERSLNREDFLPSYFASISAGFATPMQVKRYELKRYFDYQAMAAVGRIFTPLSSLRLGADFGPFSVDLKEGALKYNMASGSLDYLLNLTNLMTGYDPERKYDVQFIAGLVASMRLKPSVGTSGNSESAASASSTSSTPSTPDGDLYKSRLFFGGETGLHAAYQVSPRFKVFIEPKIRFYGKELLMQDNVQGMDIMMSLHAGTSFAF